MPARSTSADLPVDTVFFGDARRMADVPDNSVHLVVTSPPYFNVKDYSMDGWQLRRVGEREAGQIGDIADYSAYLRRTLEVLRECARVLTPNGKLALNAPLMPVPKTGAFRICAKSSTLPGIWSAPFCPNSRKCACWTPTFGIGQTPKSRQCSAVIRIRAISTRKTPLNS